MMNKQLIISALPHTQILDVDGTICVHNGYKNGEDSLLDGVKEFFAQIPAEDMIIFITSRKIEEKANLENFLAKNGLRFNHIIFDAPMGERILINDDKPSGLKMAYALNKKRDEPLNTNIFIDRDL